MINRKYNFEKTIESRNSLLILGPRGSGKSYYFKHLLQENKWENLSLNLLSREEFNKYLSHPSSLYDEVKTRISNLSVEPLVVFIDEIQLVTDLLYEIHRLIEEAEKKVVFILTGSSARKLRRKDVNLLAGRLFNFDFFPFSFQEVDCNSNLLNVVRFGLLPKSFLEKDQDIKELYLKSYAQNYLKEEIQQESLVRNLPAFNNFLEISAQNNGATVNYSKIAKIIRVSPFTVKQYYQILEDTLLVCRLPAWTHSVKKQLIQAEKFYFFDNGVLNCLLGQLKLELNYNSSLFGMLFENLVVNEINKYNRINKFDYKLFHYRTNNGAEIDLIIQKNPFTDPMAIEIKSSDYPQATDVKSLRLLKDDYPKAKLLVLCRTKNNYSKEGIDFFNWQKGIEHIFNS